MDTQTDGRMDTQKLLLISENASKKRIVITLVLQLQSLSTCGDEVRSAGQMVGRSTFLSFGQLEKFHVIQESRNWKLLYLSHKCRSICLASLIVFIWKKERKIQLCRNGCPLGQWPCLRSRLRLMLTWYKERKINIYVSRVFHDKRIFNLIFISWSRERKQTWVCNENKQKMGNFSWSHLVWL